MAEKGLLEFFASDHPPAGDMVARARTVLWDESALNPIIKEKMRIAAAEAIGCNQCARTRIESGGTPLNDQFDDLSPEDRAKVAKVEALARAIVLREVDAPDELTLEVQKLFTKEEFADLVFSLGWFIGMQNIGRAMHWDEACPIDTVRDYVEANDLAAVS